MLPGFGDMEAFEGFRDRQSAGFRSCQEKLNTGQRAQESSWRRRRFRNMYKVKTKLNKDQQIKN